MKTPSPVTLKKYGLTLDEWLKMYWKYGGRCHCCFRTQSPNAKRALHVDHEHIPNWKDLPPEERKKCLRGLLCYHCNSRLLQKGNDNRRKLKNGMRYLERYERNHSVR